MLGQGASLGQLTQENDHQFAEYPLVCSMPPDKRYNQEAVNIIRVLKHYNVDLNQRYYDGQTVLHIAASNCNESLYHQLVALGLLETLQDNDGYTPKQVLEHARKKLKISFF